MNDQPLDLAARIKARRIRLKMSQTDLAEQLGISQMQVSRYETGLHEPSAKMLVSMAQVLRTSPDWLLGFTVSVSETLSEIEVEAIQLLRTKPPDRQAAILEVMRLFN